MSWFRMVVRVAITALLTLIACDLVAALWHHYMIAPWTRDGRVRVETVEIAPEVAGVVAELRVRDNQTVHKGDVLFTIDADRFRIAADKAAAVVESRRAEAALAAAKAERRARLSDLAGSVEEKQQYASAAAMAEANVREAEAELADARLALAKTVLRSPVNGYVTNLKLRAGDYVTPGKTALVVVDKESFWVAAYFEETKLGMVRPGVPVQVQMMGYDHPARGHVESLAWGIADQNSEAGAGGLANVNPVFTWVRLAQRLPVRVVLDEVPGEIHLAAGMTCSVNVEERENLKTEAGFLPHWLKVNLF
ncbi:efflux RND transporter periplasmic adaptor subunit [Phaeospirillum tilakii]|uniref:Efflux RND transporter periplasmic adaptor subunit n=1 Tax=Phaeospirillum tilakii TaxID=741673 RepID=A0ABW5CBA2_9PROT